MYQDIYIYIYILSNNIRDKLHIFNINIIFLVFLLLGKSIFMMEKQIP